MFKRAFENVLDKPLSKPNLYPYIYSLSFNGLKKKVKNILNIKPIKCSQCGAILTDIDLIQEDEKIGTYYKCEFCETINVIQKLELSESYPKEINFTLEDTPQNVDEELMTKGTKAGKTPRELYISVIDTSGSMSGAKIEVVKKSLIQTLKEFKISSPETKYILISFESAVYYYLRHDKDPFVFAGDCLFSLDQMKMILENYVKDSVIFSIGEFADGWIRKINELYSMDMTALGPALYLAVISFNLLHLESAGRITLLTDGLANQGIGNLSGTSVSAERFYEKMAELCNQMNIIVDVVGISISGDNNEMGLQVLGKLTDHTGGKLYLISSDEMEAIFTELRQMNYIGKDVKVRIITPPSVKLKKVTGAFSSQNVKEEEINIGAVTEERELFVEIDANPIDMMEKKLESIPIQFQVEYKDNEGRKKLRIFDDRIKITKDEENFKATYDQRMNAMLNIQSSGIDDYSGKREKAKSQLQDLKKNLMEEISRIKTSNKTFADAKFVEGISFLDDELEEMQQEDIMAAEAPKASYLASVGQARVRLSQEQMRNRLEKKGKYKKDR